MDLERENDRKIRKKSEKESERVRATGKRWSEKGRMIERLERSQKESERVRVRGRDGVRKGE